VIGRIHVCASDTVKKVLFPVIREDDIIQYDKLLITYANLYVHLAKINFLF